MGIGAERMSALVLVDATKTKYKGKRMIMMASHRMM
jgi:hypothetical protein